MKSLKLVLFLAFTLTAPLPLSHAQASPSSAPATSARTTLILHVANVRNATGVIRYAIFSNSEGWPEDKSKALRYGSLPAKVGTVNFTIPDLPDGTYAISVFHDENQNHKVDRDLFGRPKEGIGFANNPKIRFSAPSWKDSSLRVAGPSEDTTIDLRYP